jgi:hypothetical protein
MMENNQYYYPQQHYEAIYPPPIPMDYFSPPEEQVYSYDKTAPYDTSLSNMYTSYPIYDSY